MDPITQGALGAIASASAAPAKNQRWAILIGWAAGMLADADIFIRSSVDPLLNIEYHRHFSHSLAFIPIGALLCALCIKALLRNKLSFKCVYVYSFWGYATAGLLDACTSYGTRLLWPFSPERIAWNIISVIDPIFTGCVLILLAIGFIVRKSRFSRIAWIFVAFYLSFGVLQKHRALAALADLVESRNHAAAQNLTVKPSIGNLALWRGIYEYESELYVDAIFVGYFSRKPRIYPGARTAKIDPAPLIDPLPANSALAHDIERFNDFSSGFLMFHPSEPNVLADARYSMIPNSIIPLWGIQIDFDTPNAHAPFNNYRTKDRAQLDRFKTMLFGKDLPTVE